MQRMHLAMTMAAFMTARVEAGTPLDEEERDLFSAAFKQALSGRRHAVRVVMSVAFQPDVQADERKNTHCQGYKSRLDAEITELCSNVTGLLSRVLLPAARDAATQTFYLKMAGDYYRYMAEFAEAAKKANMAQYARENYDRGLMAAQALSPIHPTRLGLALNFSVFLHEVEGRTEDAMRTAKEAYESAFPVFQAAAQQETKTQELEEAMVSMQLLNDNLTLWAQVQG